ncbi:MAG: Rieske 2Fe-2S domain-containing protein [Microcoleaceae cyanobacterium]
MRIFNNWNVLVKGWYIACPSQKLLEGQAKSITIYGKRIVLFRGENRQVRALDAYCPHLGTDLGIGTVEGNWIRCFFHHWAFDGAGNCQEIPCQSSIPKKAHLQAYATDEKYGFIWVYPETTAPEGVAEFDELKGKSLVFQHDKAFKRHCHHHICMMNGIDVQHLQTVHQINIKMELLTQQNQLGNVIDFTLKGQFPKTTWQEQIIQKVLGEHYEYSMRYADGCLGLLTIMKNVKLIPRLYMIYSYLPLTSDQTQIQPIYIAERRPGILGWILTQVLLLLTRIAYYALRGKDGQVYDNICFNPNAILEIDTPLVKYMNYVNTLEISSWSRSN